MTDAEKAEDVYDAMTGMDWYRRPMCDLDRLPEVVCAAPSPRHWKCSRRIGHAGPHRAYSGHNTSNQFGIMEGWPQ